MVGDVVLSADSNGSYENIFDLRLLDNNFVFVLQGKCLIRLLFPFHTRKMTFLLNLFILLQQTVNILVYILRTVMSTNSTKLFVFFSIKDSTLH